MSLVATYPILYRSHQYDVGEELPADDGAMVQAWIDAGTATWQDDDTPTPTKGKVKPVTAEAGLAGQSPNGETPDSVVGKVPKTPARSKGAKKNG